MQTDDGIGLSLRHCHTERSFASFAFSVVVLIYSYRLITVSEVFRW